MQSKSLELFTNFFAVVVAAYVGSFLASQSQGELWRKEKFYTMRMQILEKRHQLFKEMAENLNESARFAFLIGSGAKSDNDGLSKMVFCGDSRNREGSTFCDDPKPTSEAHDKFKEFAARRAQFQMLSMMSNIYFCEGTKMTLRSLPAGNYWWNIDEDRKSQILASMESDMFCAINFSDLESK